jgi:hypothetical protein
MRYRRAVEKLRILAEECDSQRAWPGEDPLLREAHVFGDLLEGPDELERVDLALVLGLPPERVAWASTPRGAMWLEESLRLNSGGFAYYWRSYLDPVGNHRIVRPVRFWSRESGPDEKVLQALAERRLDDLSRAETSPDAQRNQLAGELVTVGMAAIMIAGFRQRISLTMFRDHETNLTERDTRDTRDTREACGGR